MATAYIHEKKSQFLPLEKQIIAVLFELFILTQYFPISLSLLMGSPFSFLDQAMLICMTLAANRLLIAEDSSAGLYQKIMLNATVDDLYYALNVS